MQPVSVSFNAGISVMTHTDTDPTGLNTCLFFTKPATAYALGIFLVVGPLFSFLPQYVTLIRNKSSMGINWLMLFISALSKCFNVQGALLTNIKVLNCCTTSFTFWQCQGSMLDVYQIGAAFLNSIPIWLMVLWYWHADGDPVQIKSKYRAMMAFWMWLILNVVLLSLAIAFVVVYLNTFDYSEANDIIGDIAFVFGVISAIGNCAQFLPQIATTFKLRDPGSLSVISLAIQTPGSFLIVFFQAFFISSTNRKLDFFLCHWNFANGTVGYVFILLVLSKMSENGSYQTSNSGIFATRINSRFQ